MKIAFGCSNTYGTSLDVPQTQAWPNLIGAVNEGIPGASNLEILWKILNYKFNTDDTILIMWTIFNRDYIFPNTQVGVWQKTELVKDWINTHNETDLGYRNWLYINHANLYLRSLNLTVYNFTVDYPLLNSHRPPTINEHIYDVKVDQYKFLNKGNDGVHAGPIAHANIAREIREIINENRFRPFTSLDASNSSK